MGESFLGFPNRFNVIGQDVPDNIKNNENVDLLTVNDVILRTLKRTDSVYRPDHALSAHFGYLIAKYYMPVSGGDLTGNIYTRNIFPNTDLSGDKFIGDESSKYTGVYADSFYGNATSATKLEKKLTLELTGAIRGSVSFNGEEATVQLDTMVGHNHDLEYIKKTGDTISGSIKFGSYGLSLKNPNGEDILSMSTRAFLHIGKGLYDNKSGRLALYGYNGIQLASTKISLSEPNNSNQYNYFEISRIANSCVRLKSTRSSYAIDMKDDGKLIYRYTGADSTNKEYTIYHSGNLDVGKTTNAAITAALKSYLPVTASCNRNWHWSAQPGQPNWVWGSDDGGGNNMYAYNPSNFDVNHAIYSNRANFSMISHKVSSVSTLDKVGTFYEAAMTSHGNFVPWYIATEYKDGNMWTGAGGGLGQENTDMGLGSSANPWKHCYTVTGTVKKSDRRLKEDIKELTDTHIKFFLKLLPVSYKLKMETTGEIHIGFIAQDVEDAMNQLGLSTLDFAGLRKEIKTKMIKNEETGQYDEIPIKNEDGTYDYVYSLNYEEFIPIVTKVLQCVYQKNMELEDKQHCLDNRLWKLEHQISGMLCKMDLQH